MNHGKCPKCEGRIVTLRMETPPAIVSPTEQYNAVTLLCPHCFAVLGATLDPLAIMNETVNQVALQIRGTPDVIGEPQG